MEDSDEDSDDEYDSDYRRKKKKKKKAGLKREKGDGSNKRVKRNNASSSNLKVRRLHPILALKRKKKAVDPNAIKYIKLPKEPMPSSWGRRILPYVPKNATHAHTEWNKIDVLLSKPALYRTEKAINASYVDCVSGGLDSFVELAETRGGFHGVLLSPPWKEPRPGWFLFCFE